MKHLAEYLGCQIDETLMMEKELAAVREARECHRTAVELKLLGYPALAEWESSLSRRYMAEARLAKELCK